MRRRSRAGGERAKSQRHKAVTPKRRSARDSVGQETELARRTRERDEALEQLSATSEVLKVISGSAGELEPVFGAMLDKATRICEATSGLLVRAENDGFRIVASLRQRADIEEMKHRTFRFGPSTPIGRAVRTRQIVHVPDLSEDRAYLEREPLAVWAVEQANVRTVLVVPMLKREELVGVFGLEREEVRPFTDKQIALVQNFAAQAVIAIENTRLLNELRQRTDDLTEALEQQTATSQVLSVISSSPGELQPVFNTMLESATRICEAKFGTLFRFDGKAFHAAAYAGAPPEYIESQARRGPFQPRSGSHLERVMLTKQVSYSADNAAEPVPGLAAKLVGARSIVAVPMLKNEALIGAIIIYRQEVRSFTDKQIALVQNFAAQAVIAIENTRLLNELRQRTNDLTESLEQQTATSEVLRVISSSPGDLEPVFRAMLENAIRICDAKFGVLYLYEGGKFRSAALANPSPEFEAFLKERGEFVPDPRTGIGRIVEMRQTVHIVDAKTEPAYVDGESVFVAAVNLGGYRTLVSVPMFKENELIGAIVIYRQEVRPFTNKQVELVTNFAAQAVIAIENTRLLNELRQSLEQQTATSEVLGVISSSPNELGPVFQTILANATRLCEANFGTLNLYKDGTFPVAAMHGVPEAYAEFRRLNPQFRVVDRHPLARVAATGQVQQIFDMQLEPLYLEKDPSFVAMVESAGARTLFLVPMLKDNDVIGIITIFRQEVRPFTDNQIALVQNFAAQAVVAIENTRLLNELRQRTDDLTESLEQQTATSEVLRVISSSPGDLEPVFNAMLENAARICEANFGVMFRFDDEVSYVVATLNLPPVVDEFFQRRGRLKPTPGSDLDKLWRSKQVVHTIDSLASPVPSRIAKLAGVRTQLAVPMLLDEKLIGAIIIYRQELRPFTDKQIALLQNFAAQAVIAIENTRLLNELRQRTTDLTESLRAADRHVEGARGYQPLSVRSSGGV